MKRIKCCPFCGGYAKLRKVGVVSYVVVCNDCGCKGKQVWLDENHTLCEIQNMAIDDWNGEKHETHTA